MKILFALLLTFIFVSNACAFNPSIAASGVPASTATCAETPYFAVTTIGSVGYSMYSADYAYTGNIYGGTTKTICKVGVLLRTWLSFTDMSFRVEVWSMSGTSLNEMKSASEGRLAQTFTDTVEQQYFTFSTPVEVAAGDAIVIAETTGGTGSIKVYKSTDDTVDSFTQWTSAKAEYTQAVGDTLDMEYFDYE